MWFVFYVLVKVYIMFFSNFWRLCAVFSLVILQACSGAASETASSLPSDNNSATATPENNASTLSNNTHIVNNSPTEKTLDIHIQNNRDDAEEYTNGTVDLASSDVELIHDNFSGDQIVALRFPVGIPKDAIIEQANIQFTTDETSFGAANLFIQVENSSNSAALTGEAKNISRRTYAAERVTWAPAEWPTLNEKGSAQQTSDIKSLIQTITSKSEWTSCNYITLAIVGKGQRIAISYDKSHENAPSLHIRYKSDKASNNCSGGVLSPDPVSTGSGSNPQPPSGSTNNDTTAPSAPSSIRSTLWGVTASSIQLLWNASSDNFGIAGYNVYRDSTLISTTTNTSFFDSNLQAATTYQYRVEAFDAANNTTSSNTFSISTSATQKADTRAPTAPGNLKTSAAPSVSNIQLQWTASTDNVAVLGYRIFRDGTLLTTETSLSFNDTSVSPNNTYLYTVTAFDAANNSTSSLSLTVNTPSGQIANRSTYYISPTGSNTNSGKNIAAPWKTFNRAFTLMNAGDELILLDGIYGTATNTGGMHWDTDQYPNSKQIPSGIDAQNPTVIRALNPGNVQIDVPLFVGRTSRKDSFITVKGITFAGGNLYNSSYITVKNSGFSQGFSVGTNSHAMGNSYNLIEDVWIWASQQRIIATNYRADNNVWRRVLIRGDGCNLSKCLGSGNPNVGFTVYDSHDVSVQNVMVIDRRLNGGRTYADFATAQHTSGAHQLGRNEWLGIMDINAEDNSLVFEADSVIANETTWTIRNYLSLGGAKSGVNIGFPFSGGATPNIIENVTIHLSTTATLDGLRIAPKQNNSTVRNIVSSNAGKYAFNSASAPSYVASYSPNNAGYNQKSCTVGCYSDTTSFNAAIPYPLQIEASSPLAGAGSNGGNIGATILYKYGKSGTRYGDTGYNTLTNKALWPWPNEDRIKTEMCENSTYGFCANKTQLDGVTPQSITSYIWEYTGNQMPSRIYNP